jgi:hypothetical protein
LLATSLNWNKRYHNPRIKGAGECRDYQVDFADYESVKTSDIVRGQVIPDLFRGYNIIDIQETSSGNFE